MITFKKVFDNGLKVCYKFVGAGFSGIIEILKDSEIISFQDTESVNEKLKDKLSFILKTGIQKENYPEKYIYAYC